MNFRQLVETALVLHQRGDLAAAAKLYDQALLAHPKDPGLLGLKGILLYQQGRLDDAEPLVRKGLKLNPRDARLHNYLGQILEAKDDATHAELAFVEAIRLDPRFLEAWYNAGKLLLKQYKPREAIHALRQAASLAPADKDIQLELAIAHYYALEPKEAEAHLLRGKDLGLPEAQVIIWLSAIQSRLSGRDDGPAFTLDMVKTANETLLDTLQKVGQAELHVGNPKAAEFWLQKAIDLRPDAPAPYIHLAATRKFKEENRPIIDQMVALRERCSDAELRGLEFALGKVYSDIGEYDQSFTHYKAGNDLGKTQYAFDPREVEEMIDATIARFTKERLATLPKGSDSDLPILIVGTPRSGTTLTESVISAHSRVAGAGEMEYWPRVMPHVLKDFPSSYNGLAQRVAAEYLAFMRQHSPSADRVTDKLPGNYLHLGVIHSVFPNAKIIHCTRHPMDACLSIYFQNFKGGHQYKWDLGHLAAWYTQYQRLMAHWRSVLPPGVMYELQYEALVEDVVGESRKLMAFLGLDWEPGQLDFYKQDRAVFTASKWQARQPIYKTSKERWRRYEKHLGPLLDLLKYAPR